MSLENSVMNTSNTASGAGAGADEREIRLVDIPVQNDNIALNLMAAFLNLAQKRGAYSLEEAAKIHECIKHFSRMEKAGEEGASSASTSAPVSSGADISSQD